MSYHLGCDLTLSLFKILQIDNVNNFHHKGLAFDKI